MCRIGDIILIKFYKDINNKDVSQHPFIIIDDQNGMVKGFNVDFLAIAMSSFKNEEHKNEVLKSIDNFELTIEDGVEKESYAKASVIYYFDKSKIDYQVLGGINIETFNKIIELIDLLDCRGDVKDNFNNL